MKLKKVTVEAFRGLDQVELDLDDTTVLIGENNSGKSSFIDAIRICLDRSLARRGGSGFDDYDHHLPDGTTSLSDTSPLAVQLDFAEHRAGEWPAELLQLLNDIITSDGEGRRHVVLRVTSRFDTTLGDFSSDYQFLNAAGQPLGPKTRNPRLLNDFQRLNPMFCLSALRDASREFQPRGTLWSRFLRNPSMSAETRRQLEQELSELNAKILSAEPRLARLLESLSRVAGLVRVADGETVSIEALPARIWESLARAQVTVAAPTGAHLPLTRHGSGTQSLSVIFLHEAFLSVMLAHAFDKLSEPILAVEEPEAHLHPSAIRSLWGALKEFPGQKIVATHSGDLLAEVPLLAVRRLYRQGGTIRVGRLRHGTLNATEMRRLDLHVRRTRGELLFARCWLLAEGATEYWVFSETARQLGLDLECSGVRIVQFTSAGIAPFIKLADDLGICWHAVVDNDQAGHNYLKTVRGLLGGRAESDCVTMLPHGNVEAFLCAEGFESVYRPHLSEQKSKLMTAKPGDPDYWKELAACVPDKMKEELAIQAMAEMRRKRSVPPALGAIVSRLRTLAEVK